MKRLLYLLIILAVAGAVVLAGFFLRYRNEPVAPSPAEEMAGEELPAPELAPTETSGGATAEMPPAPASPSEPVLLGDGLRILYQNPVFALAPAPNGGVLVMGIDGAVAAVRDTAATLSPTPIAELQKALFSAGGVKALALFGDRTAPQAGVFDVASKTWQPFPFSIIDAAWSPNDSRAAYLARQNSGAVVLGVLDLANAKAKPQELLRARFADITLAWPLPDLIFLQERPSAAVPARAWIFDMKKKMLAPFAEEQRGLAVRWPAPAGASGPPGEWLAFAAGDAGRGGRLYLVSPQGTIREELTFLTLPQKCASFGGGAAPKAASAAPSSAPATLICAVPRDADTLNVSALPDAYWKRALFTEDVFLMINLATGATRTLFDDAARPLDADMLAVSGDTLYFINRYDQKLYSLQIK
ncbi:MAG: hypothetical protein HYW65_01880 [Candidatus Liptonbacteria bacterium]|nr:hypothetical protein [Candidatus Liptonbacteria bacterium]